VAGLDPMPATGGPQRFRDCAGRVRAKASIAPRGGQHTEPD
jgi:hypothetical protein